MKRIPKFKTDDVVRIVKKGHSTAQYRNSLPDGSLARIRKPESEKRDGQFVYAVYDSSYILYEDEIELSHRTVKVDVPVNDKKAAHKLAHEAVEQLFQDLENPKIPQPADWTAEEIKMAQTAIVDLVHYITMNGGGVFWSIDADQAIECHWFKGLTTRTEKTGIAYKMPDDFYNEWIGKCVSLYHAMDITLPEFIRFKNVHR